MRRRIHGVRDRRGSPVRADHELHCVNRQAVPWSPRLLTVGESIVEAQEIRKVEAYLKRLFGNARIRVVARPKKDDSAEIYIGEEFIGVLFVDDEDAERSYNFQMAILGTDLD